MPIQPTYPGVYIQEMASGIQTIVGVATSIALFIGRTEFGVMFRPTRVFSYSEFVAKFGESSTTGEMASSVRLFFQNGGTQAYIVRIASGAEKAGVVLKDTSGADSLQITASEFGTAGNLLRAEVDYKTSLPDTTFNLRLFRFDSTTGTQSEIEYHTNLSMDPNDPRYVVDFVSAESKLAEVASLADPPAFPQGGYTIAARLMDGVDDIDAYTNHVAGKMIRFVVGEVEAEVATGNNIGDFDASLEAAFTVPNVNFQVLMIEVGSGKWVLRVRVNNLPLDIRAKAAANPANDLAEYLQFGASRGGVERGAYADKRPAPSGRFANVFAPQNNNNLDIIAGYTQTGALSVEIQLPPNDPTIVDGINVLVTSDTDPWYKADEAIPESLVHIRSILTSMASQFNAKAAALPGFNRAFELQGSHLVLKATAGESNAGIGETLQLRDKKDPNNIVDLAALLPDTSNTRHYGFGAGGLGSYQLSGPPGDDGGPPVIGDYTDAYDIIRNEVDLFNLLVLPRDAAHTDADRLNLLTDANNFCVEERAFLIVDPPSKWKTIDDITNGTIDIVQVRTQLGQKDHAGLYWPRLVIPDLDGSPITVDPGGAIAGLMARIDANRGVWKAPAGLEANIRGIIGVERQVSDQENGITNPLAVNTIRVFPTGVVSWGARTVDGFDNSGNEDYKYVPVRRLALFIAESLYRGLQFAVFEGNDETLWAKIRVAAGAFMNNLFRQGAFQGEKASDAYFVKVDSETTTQNDINLGIVNVLVGFAPLKPAEFVIVTIQQIAGQVQT